MKLHCGDVCPKTGSYKVIDGHGNVINTIYVGEGETMPPTQYSDCHYESELGGEVTTEKNADGGSRPRFPYRTIFHNRLFGRIK